MASLEILRDRLDAGDSDVQRLREDMSSTPRTVLETVASNQCPL
jgi:hypothetical protein